jgi:hypothetical protein
MYGNSYRSYVEQGAAQLGGSFALFSDDTTMTHTICDAAVELLMNDIAEQRLQ